MDWRSVRRARRPHPGVLDLALLVAWLASCANAWAQLNVRVENSGGRIDASALLKEAIRRSPTVADMAATLDRSDVVVRLVVSQSAPHRPASLMYVGSSAAQRFLMIVIHPEAPREDLIAILGHELQHAVEVSASPAIRSAESLAAYFERIGRRTGTGTFETDAAIAVGRQVLSETRARR